MHKQWCKHRALYNIHVFGFFTSCSAAVFLAFAIHCTLCQSLCQSVWCARPHPGGQTLKSLASLCVLSCLYCCQSLPEGSSQLLPLQRCKPYQLSECAGHRIPHSAWWLGFWCGCQILHLHFHKQHQLDLKRLKPWVQVQILGGVPPMAGFVSTLRWMCVSENNRYKYVLIFCRHKITIVINFLYIYIPNIIVNVFSECSLPDGEYSLLKNT